MVIWIFIYQENCFYVVSKKYGPFFLNQLEFVLFSNEFAASFPNGNVTEKIRL